MPSPLIKTINDIKSLRVQGATAVAEAALESLAEFGEHIKTTSPKEFLKEIKKAGESLAYARPTEPLAQNLVANIVSKLSIVTQKGADTKHQKEILNYLVKHELREMKADSKQVAVEGEKMIKNGDKILTYCHSSTVEKILIMAKKKRKKFAVTAPETRPLFQGRITAKNLSKAGVNVKMIVDSAVSELLHKKQITKVLIGADVILRDGNVINKIGSFGVCENAHQNKIPVYVAAISLKKTAGKINVPIEKRSPLELWPSAPKHLKIENPAFDKVPAKFITGIITEKGLLRVK